MVVARNLIRNNLIGEVAAANSAPADRSSLSLRQRETLDTIIRTTKSNVSEPAPVNQELNTSSFDCTLEDGTKIMGLSKEISDIHRGPDALSSYLLSRLQTQGVQHRAESLPQMEYLEGDDIVNDFVEWAVAGASQRRLPRNMYSGLSS
jgi:hypothetical protein